MKWLYTLVPMAPLASAVVTGLFGKRLGQAATHSLAILGVTISFVTSLVIFARTLEGEIFNGPLYTWATSGGLTLSIGFLIDPLTVTMMVVVTFVSLMVHVYTIGYMAGDPGYCRFFSYISLFTFAMLMLVMSNNFLQLFFGWEAVGLVSYLLIGFWYERPSAVSANLKAFLVNRVGDFGFLLGIGLIAAYAGTLDYAETFAKAPQLAEMREAVTDWPLITMICLALFVGAMGKSAQVPLHVWLPDSMEGPTPISALIHAATMVTAGIFMVARLSPLYELSDTALSFVLVVGATTAFFMGILGIVQHDIKRVVAYSTLSQLGYMTAALGASAYSAAIFHLMTHAFFKALLFLAAGSVIIALHHEQDMRRMGGLRRFMPWTWLTALIGALALVGIPFTSGFYSKDSILIAVANATVPGAEYAYACLGAGVLVTAFYTFRMYFLVFHGRERFREEGAHDSHPHGLKVGEDPRESPLVVIGPLLLLAVPSLAIGAMTIEPMLFGDWLKGAVAVDASRHPAMTASAAAFSGAWEMGLHGMVSGPFFLALLGIGAAWFLYLYRPDLPAQIAARAGVIYRVLVNRYYFDWVNEAIIAAGARWLGKWLWQIGDRAVIDGAAVNGSALIVGELAAGMAGTQSGRLYHYAFAMIAGVVLLLGMVFLL
ncbi:MAG: NADH-quinone oxidoreductase subunit L [Hydrogenophilus sp.]|nr:NADH-quinone oxidoreductase subunit L [Hydrogenophilus sp.]